MELGHSLLSPTQISTVLHFFLSLSSITYFITLTGNQKDSQNSTIFREAVVKDTKVHALCCSLDWQGEGTGEVVDPVYSKP